MEESRFGYWARRLVAAVVIGLIIGLLPAALVLFYFLPQRGAGIFGLNAGPLVPVIVIFMNSVVWGMAAAFWEKLTGAAQEA